MTMFLDGSLIKVLMRVRGGQAPGGPLKSLPSAQAREGTLMSAMSEITWGFNSEITWGHNSEITWGFNSEITWGHSSEITWGFGSEITWGHSSEITWG
ncbi:MAG: hypothetical protein ACJ73S_33030 [Mycobacteriales bacterium]